MIGGLAVGRDLRTPADRVHRVMSPLFLSIGGRKNGRIPVFLHNVSPTRTLVLDEDDPRPRERRFAE